MQINKKILSIHNYTALSKWSPSNIITKGICSPTLIETVLTYIYFQKFCIGTHKNILKVTSTLPICLEICHIWINQTGIDEHLRTMKNTLFVYMKRSGFFTTEHKIYLIKHTIYFERICFELRSHLTILIRNQLNFRFISS